MVSASVAGSAALGTDLASIQVYWNTHLHDAQLARHPVGTAAFFSELDAYRYDKLRYLAPLLDAPHLRDKCLLEIGCGLGIDLVRLARSGAVVTGVDLAPAAVDLARANLTQHGLAGDVYVMNGEALDIPDNSFDVVYAHGVLPYTADPGMLLREAHRVLRPGGQAIVMAYNGHSWLSLMSGLTRVSLEHADAPVLRTHTAREFHHQLSQFNRVRIVPERFPVRTRLHSGLKAQLYNTLFVGMFDRLPKWLVRPLGWHLMAFAGKLPARQTA